MDTDKIININELIELHAKCKYELDSVFNDDEDYVNLKNKLKVKEQELEIASEDMRLKLQQLEQSIKDSVIDLGQTYDHLNMEIKYKKGYNRNSWDTKKLSEYSENNPEILNFRKTAVIKPSVTIVHRNIGYA